MSLCPHVVLFTVWMPEVRQLDNDMQHLVYENHAKFITASDTIKNVSTISYTNTNCAFIAHAMTV